MTIKPSAAELTHVVTAVPGVRGIEPGIGSTLKAIGSRMSGDPAAARFGIIIESGAQKVIIEVGIDDSRTVKENCPRCSRSGSALTVASTREGGARVRLQIPASGEGASTVPSLNAAHRRTVSVSGSTHTAKV